MKHLLDVPFTRTHTDAWYEYHMTNDITPMIEDFSDPVIEKNGLLEETRDELILDLIQLELEIIGVGKVDS